MIRRPPRSTQSRSSAASDVYKRQAMFMFPGRLVVFDHLRSRMRLCALVVLREGEAERGRSYDAAVAALERMAARIRQRLPGGQGISLECSPPVAADDFEGVESNVT